MTARTASGYQAVAGPSAPDELLHAVPRRERARNLLADRVSAGVPDGLRPDVDTEHAVVFDEHGFTVEHPARERVDGSMHLCPLHQYLRELSRVPVVPGHYRAVARAAGGWDFEPLEVSGG